jgi:hypothetical protein
MKDSADRGRVAVVTIIEGEPQSGPYQVVVVNGKTYSLDVDRLCVDEWDRVPGTLPWMLGEELSNLEWHKFYVSPENRGRVVNAPGRISPEILRHLDLLLENFQWDTHWEFYQEEVFEDLGIDTSDYDKWDGVAFLDEHPERHQDHDLFVSAYHLEKWRRSQSTAAGVEEAPAPLFEAAELEPCVS